jgi:hypothetical protein
MLYDPKWELPAQANPVQTWQLVLFEAANYIEANGWCQHASQNAGHICLYAAIETICRKIEGPLAPDEKATSLYLNAATRMAKFLGVLNAAVWNDAPGRTQDEVIAVMRACANSGK